jgi:hypothetical protein
LKISAVGDVIGVDLWEPKSTRGKNHHHRIVEDDINLDYENQETAVNKPIHENHLPFHRIWVRQQMLVLQLDHFLNESEFKDYALQEIRTRWNSHVVAISADAHILKVVLPKESEVPYGRDTKAYQRGVLGGA